MWSRSELRRASSFSSSSQLIASSVRDSSLMSLLLGRHPHASDVVNNPSEARSVPRLRNLAFLGHPNVRIAADDLCNTRYDSDPPRQHRASILDNLEDSQS